MSRLDTRLLTPPTEEEDIYPYRRVWPSLAIEAGIPFLLALVTIIASDFFGVQFGGYLNQRLVLVAVTLLPLALWLVFSWQRERAALQPRRRLLTTLILTALAANAVGVPLIQDILEVDQWLPLTTLLNRIIGYTFTVGAVAEITKYLVLRYTVWPHHIRTRMDCLAYSLAAGIAYATVVNLDFVLTHSPTLDTAALQVFSSLVLQLVGSAIVAYGLAEMTFREPNPMLLVATVAVGSFLVGLITPLRASFMNSRITLDLSLSQPIRGLLISAVVLVGIVLVTIFLFNVAERETSEARTEE